MERQAALASVQREPDRLEPVMRNMANAIGRLSPEMLVAMVTQTGTTPGAIGITWWTRSASGRARTPSSGR